MSDRCELKAAFDILAHCDGDECLYWRALGHLGVETHEEGCAIQAFGLLEERPEIASWLLSVKERMEALPDVDCA